MVHNTMCLSKQTYETRQEALDTIEYLKENDENFSNHVKVYKCPLCQQFHLGSK